MKHLSGYYTAIYYIMAICSLNGFSKYVDNHHLTTLLVSIFGLVAAVLYFARDKNYVLLFYIWSAVQLITFETENFHWVTYQFTTLNLSLILNGEHSLFQINFLPILFLVFARFALMQELVGKTISIEPVQQDGSLPSVEVKVVEVLNLDSDGRWLKVEYTAADTGEKMYWMIRPKGEESFSKKKTIVAHVNAVGYETQFLGWAWARIVT